MSETPLESTAREQAIQSHRKIIRVGSLDITLSEPFEVKFLTDRLRAIVTGFHRAFPEIHFRSYEPTGLVQGISLEPFDEEKGQGHFRGTLLDETINNYLVRWTMMNQKERNNSQWSFFTRRLWGNRGIIGHSLVNTFYESASPQKVIDLLAHGYFEGNIEDFGKIYESAGNGSRDTLSLDDLLDLPYISPQMPDWLLRSSTLAASDPHHDAVILYLAPHVAALTIPPLMHIIRGRGLTLTPETWGGALLAEAAVGSIVAVHSLQHEVCHGLGYKRFQNRLLVQDGFHIRT